MGGVWGDEGDQEGVSAVSFEDSEPQGLGILIERVARLSGEDIPSTLANLIVELPSAPSGVAGKHPKRSGVAPDDLWLRVEIDEPNRADHGSEAFNCLARWAHS